MNEDRTDRNWEVRWSLELSRCRLVSGNDKFVRRGGSRGEERGEFVKKAGKGFRKGRRRWGAVDIEEG